MLLFFIYTELHDGYFEHPKYFCNGMALEGINCRGLDRWVHKLKLATCNSPNTSDLRVVSISNALLMQLICLIVGHICNLVSHSDNCYASYMQALHEASPSAVVPLSLNSTRIFQRYLNQISNKLLSLSSGNPEQAEKREETAMLLSEVDTQTWLNVTFYIERVVSRIFWNTEIMSPSTVVESCRGIFFNFDYTPKTIYQLFFLTSIVTSF